MDNLVTHSSIEEKSGASVSDLNASLTHSAFQECQDLWLAALCAP